MITPQFTGQYYRDTTTGNIWKSNSTTPGDWSLLLQDMQVAWTPNILFGEEFGILSDMGFGSDNCWQGIVTVVLTQAHIPFIDIETTTDLVSISAPNLIDITAPSGYLAIKGNPVLVSVSLPSLVDGGPTGGITIANNPALTTLNIGAFLPTPGDAVSLNGNALNVVSVDMALARCVAVPTWGNAAEHLLLNGGTNAPPSSIAPGSDYAILVARGAIVSVN